jgi:hypothetical protein
MTDKITKLKWMWCGEKEQVANFPTGCILRVYKDNKWTENVVAQTWIPGYNYDGRETGFYLIDQSDDMPNLTDDEKAFLERFDLTKEQKRMLANGR